MVQVAFHDADDSPTQAYALARWRENPKISPSSWRQMLGCTVGKIAFDARAGVQGLREAIAMGCNLVVAYATQLEDVLGALDDRREQVVVIGVGAAYRDGTDWWMVEAHDDPDSAGLAMLEQAVKENRLAAYGVTGEADMDLQAWLAAATEVAATVWGRRKRSGLRVVEIPLNGVEQEALRGPQGDASVSVLDYAARLGMAVLVRRAAHWQGPWGEVAMGLAVDAPLPEAVAALVAVGEAEKSVDGLSGGVLPALAAGASPWPSRAAWRLFETKVWPGLEQALLQRGEEIYVAAWRRFLPYGAGLAAVFEGRLAAVLGRQLAFSLPKEWQDTAVLAQAWGLASSVPGVGAVVAELGTPEARKAMMEAMERPDVIDVKRALDGVIHRA